MKIKDRHTFEELSKEHIILVELPEKEFKQFELLCDEIGINMEDRAKEFIKDFIAEEIDSSSWQET
jgi:hypothetical protein